MAIDIIGTDMEEVDQIYSNFLDSSSIISVVAGIKKKCVVVPWLPILIQ